LNNLDISLICTVKNEEKTIKALLDSITIQTKKPKEIIFVDGGSIDGTAEIIKSYSRSLPIVFVSSPGSNIAKGRNQAVAISTCDYIVGTDVGCKLAVDWIEKITDPFNQSDVEVVCGVYKPWFESDFEELASYLIFPKINKISPSKFMPSGRSIAYRKKAWAEVEGYPEWLETAEDTLFDLNLAKKGKKFALARDAVVYWRIRESTAKIFKQYFNYSKGEGKELLYPERYLLRYLFIILIIISIIFFKTNLLFWGLLIPTFFAGLWLKYLRNISKITFKRFFKASLVALAIESGIILGFLKGLIQRKKNRGIIRRKLV
jgi:glycosyltransferase involved in cell wall biosynthesis